MNRFKFVIFLLLAGTVFGCGRNEKERLDIDTRGLFPEKVTIKQYGKALFKADTTKLKEELFRLQPDFMHFLDADLEDSANIMQIRDFVSDTQLIRLYNKSREVYSDMQTVNEQLTHAFRRLHYHFPQIRLPEVYTYISGVHYELPVMLADGIAAVGIDCYLGADFTLYRQLGIPQYLINRMTTEHLLNDLFKVVYQVMVDPSLQSRTIMDEMVGAGKRLYFQEAMQPRLADHLIIGFTPEQWDWVELHEAELWAHLVGEELLFSTDFNAFKRLFGDGPFSGDFSRDAPPRLGEWVGWQIVRNYMKNNPEISLKELLQTADSQQILSGSRYRPK
jgi:hypothetical protein